MTSIQTFHKTLSDIVSSDKLSSSRVEKVRSEVADNFNRADELVKIIAKVHNSSSTKTKISSLYLFDAMARCAQDVIKRRASGFRYRDSKPPKGSNATAGTKEAMIDSANGFLGACNRIVEEIVLTTAQSVREDQREKVAKVVDIWIKANTFDQGMLERIRAKALRGEGFSQSSAMSNEDEKGNSMPSPYGMLMNENEDESREGENGSRTTKSPPPTIPNVPANLLAMLGAPAKTASTSLPAQNTEKPPAASLDPNQLAMLRRVAAQQQQQQEQQSSRQGYDQAKGSNGGGTFGQKSRETSLPNRPNHSISDVHTFSNTGQHGNNGNLLNDESIKNSSDPSSEQMLSSSLTTSSQHFKSDQSVGDLSQFDLSNFDPTKSEDWLKLAQQWFNTYQYIPSNQELMTGLISVMQSQMYMQQQQQMMSGEAGGGGEMENDTMMMMMMGGGSYTGNDTMQEGNQMSGGLSGWD